MPERVTIVCYFEKKCQRQPVPVSTKGVVKYVLLKNLYYFDKNVTDFRRT